MNTIKKYLWLLAIVILVAPSCKDEEGVNGPNDYSFYLDIQTGTRLHLREAADEEESGMVNPTLDGLSRTIYHMQEAVRKSDQQKGNRNKVATMLSTCDSLYRDYADVNPEQKGNVVCYVKLLRCPLNPNGTANLNDAVTLKYYIFWRDESGN